MTALAAANGCSGRLEGMEVELILRWLFVRRLVTFSAQLGLDVLLCCNCGAATSTSDSLPSE